MFQEKMFTPATPERVYTLCKIVEKRPISNTELKEKMEPDFLGGTTSYFAFYRSAAEELRLIIVSDNMVSLAVDSSVIKSMDAMRRYVISMLELFQDGHFYKVTQAYFGKNEKILSGETNISNITDEMTKLTGNPIIVDEMRAWRFWASYLGLGYLQEMDKSMLILPNADVFLHDVINLAGFEKGKRYTFGEFVDRISPLAKIIMDKNFHNKQMNYGFSNGLRTLHDMGIIKLEHIMDQEDIWSLYPLKSHSIPGTVTNITICK